MNIKRIEIKNLFNTFTHKIVFNDKVTIIMGENGVGKTVTLHLIEAIFEGNFEYLLNVDYSEIIVTFKKETWTIKRRVNYDEEGKHPSLTISSSKSNTVPFDINEKHLVSSLPPWLVRVDENTWRNNRSRALLDRDQLYERYGIERLMSNLSLPSWFVSQQKENRVKLIKTQRILSVPSRNDLPTRFMVDVYSEELGNCMRQLMSKASISTGDMDRSFPKRLLKLMKAHMKFDAADIIKDLHELEDYRLQLSMVGLLTEVDESENIQEEDLNQEDKTMLSVMYQYIKDSRMKLKQYDELYRKLSILKSIINMRFKHKVFSFDSFQGFVFYPESNPSGSQIPVSKLSSGEQNELVLFYELLFKCDEKDLILIDEPEISLHLEWLQEMINDLLKITKANDSSLLIATHSPDFVGDNYELVQNLS